MSEEYHGFQIEFALHEQSYSASGATEATGGSAGAAQGVCDLQASRPGDEPFVLTMVVTRPSHIDSPLSHAWVHGHDAEAMALHLGRRWIHGLIHLGRVQPGGRDLQVRRDHWHPFDSLGPEYWEPYAVGNNELSDEQLRLELLRALHRMHRAQRNTSEILDLDVQGIADVLRVPLARVRGVMGDLLVEGLAEPCALTFDRDAEGGCCRITRLGLATLRDVENPPSPRRADQPQDVKVPRAAGQTPIPAAAGGQGLTTSVELFYSYSHTDEALRDELEKHLALLKRQGLISWWHDRRIVAGADWEREIDAHLDSARVILLLVSADFLASDYCWGVEVRRAMERHGAGEARVIPVILRDCDWHKAPFGKLQAVPREGRAVTSWPNRDEAFADVARRIRAAVEELAANPR